MPDLVLKKLSIRNWMTIHNVELDFPESGIVWVTGSNIASDGKLESVGAGKTAIGEAICRTLNGLTGRFSRLGDCSTHKKGDLYIKLEANLRNKPLVVELGHRCSELSRTGEGLRFSYDGQTIERSRIEETREELTKTIRVTQKLARWTVFIDGDKLKFNDLSERDSVELLMAALSQPPWTQWHEASRKTSANFETAHTQAESDHATAIKSRLTAETERQKAATQLLEAEATFKKKQESHDQLVETVKTKTTAKTTKLAALKKRAKEIEQEIVEIENQKAATYAELQASKLDINSKLHEERTKKDKLLESRTLAGSAWKVENTKLNEMKDVPKECPTCQRPWDKAHAETEIEKQQKIVDTKKQASDKATERHKTQLDVIQDLQDKLDRTEKSIRDLNVGQRVKALSAESKKNSETQEEIEVEIEELNEDLVKLQSGVDDTDVQQKKTVVTERTRVQDNAEEKLRQEAATLAEAKEALKVVRYWTKAFGPTGIPNMVLKESIEPLNDTSRRISSILTGGMIVVAYDTSRELVTGNERAELVINITNKLGSMSAEGSSKGESGLNNLIVSETLSSVGSVSNRIGFRWYDEILNSQDPTVRRAILAYLKDLATKLGILVFVVDHHPETANFANHTLVAEKGADGHTTCRWA